METDPKGHVTKTGRSDLEKNSPKSYRYWYTVHCIGVTTASAHSCCFLFTKTTNFRGTTIWRGPAGWAESWIEKRGTVCPFDVPPRITSLIGLVLILLRWPYHVLSWRRKTTRNEIKLRRTKWERESNRLECGPLLYPSSDYEFIRRGRRRMRGWLGLVSWQRCASLVIELAVHSSWQFSSLLFFAFLIFPSSF